MVIRPVNAVEHCDIVRAFRSVGMERFKTGGSGVSTLKMRDPAAPEYYAQLTQSQIELLAQQQANTSTRQRIESIASYAG